MRFGRATVVIIIFTVTVLFLYLATFYSIEHMRQRKGPWVVRFESDPEGKPALIVQQGSLKINDVRLVPEGERISATNLSQRVAFDRPMKPVPFGTVIYQDLTSLPGVVTFNLFGHEVELLPRTLIVDKREIRWESGATIALKASEKPATPLRKIQ